MYYNTIRSLETSGDNLDLKKEKYLWFLVYTL